MGFLTSLPWPDLLLTIGVVALDGAACIDKAMQRWTGAAQGRSGGRWRQPGRVLSDGHLQVQNAGPEPPAL